MTTSAKLTLFGSVITAVGGIAAALISSGSATTSAPLMATNGGFSVSGINNDVRGNISIQNSTVNVNTEGQGVQTAASPLIGKWHGISRYTVPEGELTSSGYSEFLQTGHYNFTGELTLRNAEKIGPDAAIVSRILATGTWRATGGKYSIALVDMKTVKTVKRQSGQADVDLDQIAAAVPGASRFRLEDVTPKGASQEFTVLELTATSLRATGQDLSGYGVDYVAARMQ